jgi:catechol 2,3-dioxygenase-like lactoylglutathione lyase family enzyme
MIHDIDQTNFTVRNMEKSNAFYRDVIGMKVIWDSVKAGGQFKGPEAGKVTGCSWKGMIDDQRNAG